LEIAMGFKTILVPIEQHDLMNSTFWGFVNGGEQWRTGLWRRERNWVPTFSSQTIVAQSTGAYGGGVSS
jgi:hypothetical protein